MGNYSIDIQKKALKYDVKQKTARFNRAGRRIFGYREKDYSFSSSHLRLSVRRRKVSVFPKIAAIS